MKNKKPKEPEKVNIAMFNWGPCVVKDEDYTRFV